MRRCPIKLFYRGVCRAELVSPISESHLQCWREDWKVHFEAQRLLNGKPEEDAHWDWDALSKLWQPGVDFTFAIEADGETQALMWATLGHLSQMPCPWFCKIAARLRLVRKLEPVGILYVERIATAPKNRGRPLAAYQSQYKLCGERLLKAAVELSFDLGSEGRVGLHALPGARTFYKDLGMTQIPSARKDRMEYFEFAPNEAKKFIEG